MILIFVKKFKERKRTFVTLRRLQYKIPLILDRKREYSQMNIFVKKQEENLIYSHAKVIWLGNFWRVTRAPSNKILPH